MTFLAFLSALLLALLQRPLLAGEVPRAAAEIRAEATRANVGEEGWPLPLASHWCTGSHSRSQGWAPKWQMQLVREGHHILPWFQHPHPGRDLSDEERLAKFRAYYEGPIKTAAAWKLPLVFKAPQWESILSREPYRDLPPEKNPNVIAPDGTIKRMVSPFGPIAPWREAGRHWTEAAGLKKLQEWYPDPPLVIFLSNNEHRKLRWHQVEQSKRYLDAHGKGKSDDFKRRTVSDGWIERYRALQEGMRDGLTSAAWKANALFVGYGAFGPAHLGRWGGWPKYSLHSQGRISPAPLTWDGGSPSYYTHDWNPSTDHKTWSPQVQFMNLVFMKGEALQLNPKFWYEFSVWDGHTGSKKEGKKTPSKRAVYEMHGQTYGPTRYEGWVQFGMWLTRPRAVREFRGWTYPWEEGVDYFMGIVRAVDRVYENDALREWWRTGKLVPNRAHEHLYQTRIPEEYQDADRWFLLDANVNPKQYPWEMFWNVPVFSLAYVKGEAPQRRWLIYAHSPLKDRKGVKLTIPEYRQVTVDVAVGGSFYEVDEASGRVEAVK